ncbi:hypothetical protein ISN45_At03g029870 [Arabidopsis thaliana x Arabidopsis arenosa]|uniref:WAT1-related protein n=1 Tax=Arabidopsis thaliana x Arabidopsis arenosa TaxID=1240361 RepID=A0A8T2ETS5_9BRAS|nr:hypothetical protein ISN45_At03g029870 [Arabidopsis thaliana x Arabidopsis arenosa]
MAGRFCQRDGGIMTAMVAVEILTECSQSSWNNSLHCGVFRHLPRNRPIIIGSSGEVFWPLNTLSLPSLTLFREYPSEFALALSHNVCVSISCAFVSLFVEENNPSAWIMRSKIMLICIVATGVVNSTSYVVESWTVRYKGAVFLAMFRPLSIVTAVVLGAIFLGDSLYLGSVIGGTLISIGFSVHNSLFHIANGFSALAKSSVLRHIGMLV